MRAYESSECCICIYVCCVHHITPNCMEMSNLQQIIKWTLCAFEYLITHLDSDTATHLNLCFNKFTFCLCCCYCSFYVCFVLFFYSGSHVQWFYIGHSFTFPTHLLSLITLYEKWPHHLSFGG